VPMQTAIIIRDGIRLVGLALCKILYEVNNILKTSQHCTHCFIVVSSVGGYDEPMEKTANPYLYDSYGNHELISFEQVLLYSLLPF
jgi:hypothetical protein